MFHWVPGMGEGGAGEGRYPYGEWGDQTVHVSIMATADPVCLMNSQ